MFRARRVRRLPRGSVRLPGLLVAIASMGVAGFLVSAFVFVPVVGVLFACSDPILRGRWVADFGLGSVALLGLDTFFLKVR